MRDQTGLSNGIFWPQELWTSTKQDFTHGFYFVMQWSYAERVCPGNKLGLNPFGWFALVTEFALVTDCK